MGERRSLNTTKALCRVSLAILVCAVFLGSLPLPSIAQGVSKTDQRASTAVARRGLDAGAELYAKVSPAVFMVHGVEGKMQGSGVAYAGEDSLTLIATNAHVISGSKTVEISYKNKRLKTIIVFMDSDMDLALLAVAETLPVLESVDFVGRANIGQRVYAIGSPLGLENTITEGILSGRRQQRGMTLLQTSAPISPGNSGGGLFDADGTLLGITTFKLKGGDGLNFAIDSKHLGEIGDAFVTAGKVWKESGWQNQGVPLQFISWMAAISNVDGRPRYQYANEQLAIAQNAKTAQERNDGTTIIAKSLVMEWDLSRVDKKPPFTPAQSSSVVQLSCEHRGNYYKLMLNEAQSTFNGRPATFTEDAVTISLDGDEPIRARLDRLTGTLAIQYLGDGIWKGPINYRCHKVDKHAF